MKTFIVFLFLFLFSFSVSYSQHLDRKTIWECQYILHKDSANKIFIDKMMGIGAFQMENDSVLNLTCVCNKGTAKIKFGKDNSVQIGDISRTMLWCDQKNKELDFLRYLSLATAYEVNSTGLKLFIKSKKEYLFFVGH